jgi:5'-AMP-activated protein kinase catalytic alpha subunit
MGKIKIPRLLIGRYELGKLLGKGSFAKVYHVRNLGTIKIMDVDHLSKLGAMQQQIMHEIHIIRQVYQPSRRAHP